MRNTEMQNSWYSAFSLYGPSVYIEIYLRRIGSIFFNPLFRCFVTYLPLINELS